MKRWRFPLAAAMAAGLVAASFVSAAIDPFYENLLRKGTDAFNRRDYPAAARLLRLAAFGMLEEPQELANVLTQLALAQAAMRDQAGFRDTFERLTEVEERFHAYSSADIPADVRAALKAQAQKFVAPATLAASPLFAAPDTRDDTLGALPPAQERSQLLDRIAQHPDEVRWRLQLAELDLAHGRADEALSQADSVVAISPGSTVARALRGRAYAANGKWAEAIQDLTSSGEAARSTAAARALLEAYLAQGSLSEASGFVAALPAAIRTSPEVAPLIERLSEAQKSAP